MDDSESHQELLQNPTCKKGKESVRKETNEQHQVHLTDDHEMKSNHVEGFDDSENIGVEGISSEKEYSVTAGESTSDENKAKTVENKCNPINNNNKTKGEIQIMKKLTRECECCKEVFTNEKQYELHFRKHKSDEKPKTSPKEHINRVKFHRCGNCEAKFISKKKYQQHIQTHKAMEHMKNIYIAKVDNAKTSGKTQLVIKTRKTYFCPHCSKDCKSNTVLTRHIRVHTKEKPYKCHLCEKGFATNAGRSVHIKRHQGVKPHKCSYCDKSFVKKWALVEHIRVHTGEKPYKCDVCEKSFRFKNVLTSHMFLHSSKRPFNCNICGQGFIRQFNLDEHLRNHTGEKPFKCSCCGLTFKNHCNWKLHEKKHTEAKDSPIKNTNASTDQMAVERNTTIDNNEIMDQENINKILDKESDTALNNHEITLGAVTTISNTNI